MKKILIIAVAAFVVSCSKPAPAPETWNCDFKGQYVEKGETVPFTWKVTWANTQGDNWKITGAAAEADAKSSTTGSCDAKTCKIDETYTAGENKGKSFYWVGTYTDAETKNENVLITSFTGTFGPTDADRTSMGTWSAKADCKNANPAK